MGRYTHEIQAALGDVDSTIAQAGRARSAFMVTGDTANAAEFEAAVPQVLKAAQRVRELTKDNPKQQEYSAHLEETIRHRIELFSNSIKLRESSPQDLPGQADISREALPFSSETTSIMKGMRDEERRLLGIREERSGRLFRLAIIVLAVTFVLALALFSVHYRLLSLELTARGKAERIARDSEDSLRRLTGRLLQLQDEERRKFSRELHDSLGQYLAGVKMNLEMFSRTQPTDSLLSEAIQMLDQSISETRTISHLLHPPLLDEAGFASAARWYVEGFAQRSGIQVKTDIPDDVGRMPKAVELSLFRVLQEGLTNIHRHSGSSKAEISLKVLPGRVVLEVVDYGRGIPQDLLGVFRSNGTNSGVGLAGMRERIRELGGQLDIQSGPAGTGISAIMPLARRVEATQSSAAD